MKQFFSFVLSFILLLMVSTVSFAGNEKVKTEDDAIAAAKEEIEVWKQLGLLQKEVSFEGEPDAIVEIEPQTGDERWYGREFPHAYEVRWYVAARVGTELEVPAFGCNLRIDAATGKIINADIEALASEDAKPVPDRTFCLEMEDPQNPDKTITKTFFFYDNFDDIFPADMTVDRFCTLLAEYWGFSGYTLAETVDPEYFDEPQSPVPAELLLMDLDTVANTNYYLTVFFDGDQEGAPIYLSLHQYAGYVMLSVGITHAVG